MIRHFIFASSEPHPDFVSRGIQTTLGTDYSHIGNIVIAPFLSEPMIWQSTGIGVHPISVAEFLKKKKFMRIYEVTHLVKNPEMALGWLMGNEGKDYSESQYIPILFSIVKMKVPKFMERLYDKDSELICSEFSSRFLGLFTDLMVFRECNFDLLTPRDVCEKLDSALIPFLVDFNLLIK